MDAIGSRLFANGLQANVCQGERIVWSLYARHRLRKITFMNAQACTSRAIGYARLEKSSQPRQPRKRSVFGFSFLPGSAATCTVGFVTSDLSIVPARSAAGILVRSNLTLPADERLDQTGRAADYSVKENFATFGLLALVSVLAAFHPVWENARHYPGEHHTCART
jgi:hypothetical protein